MAGDSLQPKIFFRFAVENIRVHHGLTHNAELANPLLFVVNEESMAKHELLWDVFISHASEDKEGLVRPLAKELLGYGVRVWYDEFSLQLGDSLSRSIDKGLAKSRFGIVVLSPSFLAKNWPEYELRGLVAREMEGGKVIIPLWYNISRAEVLQYSPPLADKFAIIAKDKTGTDLALELIKVVQPELHSRIVRRLAYLEQMKSAKTIFQEVSKIKLGPKLHKNLSPDLLGRIRMLRAALWGVHTHSMDFWMEGFMHDAHPTQEVQWWEHVASCYLECSAVFFKTKQDHENGFRLIFGICMGFKAKDISKYKAKFPKELAIKISKICSSRMPLLDIDEQLPVLIEEIDSQTLRLMQTHDIEHFE